MIELGKFTSDISEEGYIGVQIAPNVEIYARPVMAFPIIACITPKWLEDFGDKFQAVVDYEYDTYENPLLIGIVPIKNTNFPTEGYEDNYFFYGNKFRIWLDETNNKCVVDVLADGKVMLGNKDVTEKAMLGNKFNTLFDKLIDEIKKITVVSPVGATSTPVNSPALDALKQEFAQTLSETVKLK